MGFETMHRKAYERMSFIMKPSLWDLKQTLSESLGLTNSIMKPSLWDLKLQKNKGDLMKLQNHETIPMGFETFVGLVIDLHFGIMKPSLWDLKPTDQCQNGIGQGS